MALATGSYEFLSVVRGHHVYKDIWTPVIDEQLTVKKEDSNEHDRYALSVVRHGSDFSDETYSEAEEDAATTGAVSSEAIVGHVPREYSKLLWFFIHRGGSIVCKITERRQKGNGLEVPCSYHCVGAKRLIKQLKQKLETMVDTPLSCPF